MGAIFSKANRKNSFAKPATAKSIVSKTATKSTVKPAAKFTIPKPTVKSMAMPKKSPVKKFSERKLGDYPDLAFGLYNGDKKIGFYPTLDPKQFVDRKKVVRNPYRNNAP